MWIEHYNCGCTGQAKTKRDLPGYCAVHGGDWKDRYNTVSKTAHHNVKKGAAMQGLEGSIQKFVNNFTKDESCQ